MRSRLSAVLGAFLAMFVFDASAGGPGPTPTPRNKPRVVKPRQEPTSTPTPTPCLPPRHELVPPPTPTPVCTPPAVPAAPGTYTSDDILRYRRMCEELKALEAESPCPPESPCLCDEWTAYSPEQEGRLADAIRAARSRVEPTRVAAIAEQYASTVPLASRFPGVRTGAAAAAGGAVEGVSWQSNVLYGLTAFLLDRARAEAAEGFLLEMRDELCGIGDEGFVTSPDPKKQKRFEATRALFPSTCGLLVQWKDADVVPPFGSSWQAALSDDLEKVFEHYFKWRNLTEGDGPAIDALVKMTLDLVRRIQDGEHALIALKAAQLQLGAFLSPIGDRHCSPLSTMEAVDMAAYLLIGVFGLRYELRGDDLMERTVTKADVDQFLGTLLPCVVSRIPDYDKRLPVILERADALKRQIALIVERDKNGDRKAEDVRHLLSSLSRALRLMAALDKGAAEKAEAVADLLDLIIDSRAAAAEGQWGLFTVRLASAVAKLDIVLHVSGDPLPESFLRLASLAGDVGRAKTQAEVKEILEANAAPLGSFRAKRGARGHVTSITGFVGLGGGYERLDEGPSRDSAHLGLSVPMGVEVAFGAGRSRSVGLFASLIDLGAIGSYRLKSSDAVQSAPQIGFSQVLSPGLFFTWGLSKKLPFVVGVGGQVSPKLRRVTVEGAQERDVSSKRITIFFAVDVTLFRF
jgi:hypothetical protein